MDVTQLKEKNAPYIPEDAPFSDEQRSWLSGFFAGINTRLLNTKGSDKADMPELVILYGSQTGNAEGLANTTVEKAAQFGLKGRVCSMDAFDLSTLPSVERLFIITSTYGEGEMPDNSQGLWDLANSDGAPALDNTRFSVCALGDTSYDLFCQSGKDWDKKLEELGGERVFDRKDCDVDFEEPYEEWVLGALTAISKGVSVPGGAVVVESAPKAPGSQWTRKNPFRAKLLKNEILTAHGSSKETRHYEISLAGSDIVYEVGDALGVYSTNCPQLVEDIISALGCSGEEMVPGADGKNLPLKEVLFSDYEIKLPSKEFISAVATGSGDSELHRLIKPENKEDLSKFMWGRDTLDLLLDYPKAEFSPTEFVGFLKKLQARAYSISSSINKHPGEVHLTIASVRYETFGRPKKGVCSTFLADRVGEDGDVPVYLMPNKHFGIPENDDLPMIMVGPGTGVAPFRAFLEEREVRGSKGKNWLFFGERNSKTDFFYENELKALEKKGVLTRLDLAFSRDQEEKIYVQDRMRENSRELYAWLQEGGYFFVCGDAYRMAKDVDKALHDVIQKEGGLSESGAVEYVNNLKKEKRYVRDVY